MHPLRLSLLIQCPVLAFNAPAPMLSYFLRPVLFSLAFFRRPSLSLSLSLGREIRSPFPSPPTAPTCSLVSCRPCCIRRLSILLTDAALSLNTPSHLSCRLSLSHPHQPDSPTDPYYFLVLGMSVRDAKLLVDNLVGCSFGLLILVDCCLVHPVPVAGLLLVF
jgi:hypothetical protein